MKTINKLNNIMTVITTVITIYNIMIKTFEWYQNKHK